MKTLLLLVVSIILLFCMLFSDLNVHTAEAEPDTIYVWAGWNANGDGTQSNPYQNITCGLEYAEDGYTIFVYNGTYNESLVVNKAVWLNGQTRDSTNINGTRLGDVVIVNSPNVKTSGFNITNSGRYDNGVWTNKTNLTVEDCRISDCYISIYLHNAEKGNISSNIIVGNWSHCIAVIESNEANIAHNEITRTKYVTEHGIDVNASSHVTIVYNNITDHIGDGVYLCTQEGDYGSITISHNLMLNNTYGLRIATYGDLAKGFSDAIITDNNFTKNKYAVFHAKEEQVSCQPHRFCHNYFINNTNNNITFCDATITHVWNDSYPSSGNYWSDYAGNDVYSGPYQNVTGSDNIGDTSHTVSCNNTDNKDYYPIMSPDSRLAVKTMYLGTELYNVSVWIDGGEELQSPVNETVMWGLHEVEVDQSFIVPIDEWNYYRYTFVHWEDYSTDNPRLESTYARTTLTAYYTRRIIGVGK